MWRSSLETGTSPECTELFLEAARRLRLIDLTERAATVTKQQTRYPEAAHWIAYGVAQGYAGLALMCSYLDECFPGDKWDATGHQLIEIAGRALEKENHVSLGLYAGLSGVAFAALSLSRNGSRYQKFLSQLDGSLNASVPPFCDRIAKTETGLSVSEWDLISGITGVGAYLMASGHKRIAPAFETLLRTLICLFASRDDPPPWHTPPNYLSGKRMRSSHPGGNLNCGLAHGAPCPLSLLSLAMLNGYNTDGIREAIDSTATWIIRNRSDDKWGINWPSVVPLPSKENDRSDENRPIPSRSGWCYGAPGVARSLWLAGRALNRKKYRDVAVAAMEAVSRRPISVRHIDSPTFCHGVAGLLQIVLRFAHDTKYSGFFVQFAHSLIEQLLSQTFGTRRSAFHNRAVFVDFFSKCPCNGFPACRY
jgi:hypothetical protein